MMFDPRYGTIMKSLFCVNTAWCALLPPASDDTSAFTDPSLFML
jgi:hypothetical protein